MHGWYRDSNPQQRKVFWACLGGWAVDALDVQVFSLAIPALIASLSISKSGAGLLAGITLVTGATGGWLGGALSDRIGRVRALQTTILVFSIATLACAFAQNFTQLALVKALQGLGFGAEWSAGAALMAETFKPEGRGRAMAVVQSGWAIGWGGAVIAFGVFSAHLPLDLAWRAMFATGVLPALAIFLYRLTLKEPAVKSRHEGKPDYFNSLFGIFRKENRHATFVGGLLGFGAHGGFYGLFTWLPTFLKEERHLSVMKTSSYLAVIIVAFGIGCVAAGQFLDRVGRRLTMVIYALGCILVAVTYLVVPLEGTAMLVLGFPLGFFAAGIPASMGALFNELFPPEVRGSGAGFCYNAGRILAAALPALIGGMADRWSLGVAIGLDAGLAYSLVIVAVLLLPARTVALKGLSRAA